ncbi:MAG: GNAT family N-acetyltransferase [Candidatus Aenigmatarchaeota archaeon]
MVFSLKVITDFEGLRKIENEWNRFLIDHAENPFLLSGYVKEFIDINLLRGQLPIIFVALENKKVVGLALFALKKRFNFLINKFLLPLHFSPDILVHEDYEERTIRLVINRLFYDMGCQLLDLTLPAESQHIETFKKICKINNIYFRECLTLENGHYVLPINGSWGSFEKLLGGNFRRLFKRLEHKMIKAGGYEITCAEKVQDNVFKDILYIDKKSWKEVWRKKKRMKVDPELFAIWRGTVYLNGKVPDLKWRVWFLKINNVLASYAFTLQFKNIGYIVKTSFNNEFKNFYPGIYVINVAIKDFFDRGEVEKIDFQTNLPFMRRWKPILWPRVRVMIGKGSLFSFTIFLSTNRGFCKVRDKILGSLFDALPLVMVG